MTAIDQEPMFLRPAEAAALAGLSTRAIYRAIQRGELRAVRLCSRLRIPRDGFDEWIARAAVCVEPRGRRGARRPGGARKLPPAPGRRREEDSVMSVERVERKDGSVVWRVRWRQGGRNRSKVLGRKRDAEAFDAELVRRKRTGELRSSTPARSRWPSSARSGGGCTPSRTSRARRYRSTPCSGTRTSCRASARSRCAS